MIEIVFDRPGVMELRGHAGAGDYGKDLVCSAVTALTLALRESCKESELRPGYGRLFGADPEIMDAFARGYELLAKFFPDYVH